MNLVETLQRTEDALGVAEHAFELGRALVSAVRRRQWDKVDRILSGELKTTLAKAAADARAADHFDQS